MPFLDRHKRRAAAAARKWRNQEDFEGARWSSSPSLSEQKPSARVIMESATL